jgi:RNA polymerase sigma factor (sigma-70 family)
MQAREINLKLILDGCLRRNRNSQRKLYEYFFGYGMNVCLRYAKNRQEAEEILNNAFLKIFTNLDKYDPAYPFRTWLRRILINSAVDYFRATRNTPFCWN